MDTHVTMRTLKEPFPSCLVSLCQYESLWETIHMKMCSAYWFIFMQIKLIFIWRVLHEYSFWNRGTRLLGNGLFCSLPLELLVIHRSVCTWRVWVTQSVIKHCVANPIKKHFLPWWRINLLFYPHSVDWINSNSHDVGLVSCVRTVVWSLWLPFRCHNRRLV